jgi:hypothetical protein
MSAMRSSAVWWDSRRGSFPRPLTIYAGSVENVSGRGADSASISIPAQADLLPML